MGKSVGGKSPEVSRTRHRRTIIWRQFKVEEEASPSYDKVYHQVGWQTLFNSIAESDGNAVISPLSVMGGMFMLAAGSDGDSQQEIYDVMNLGHLEGMDYVTSRLL